MRLASLEWATLTNALICRSVRVQNQSEVSVRQSSYAQVKPTGDHDHPNVTEDV
jgi:hypothetical protein